MAEFFQKFWLETLCTSLFSGLCFSVKFLWSRVKQEHAEQSLIKAGVLAILHDRLFQSCRFFICKKEITVDELKNIEFLYTAYHALGGNGTCTELYNRVRALPIKD